MPTGVGSQSQNLTFEGEVTSFIRDVAQSEINCKAVNSSRLIDNTVNISLDKVPERCVPYLIEILCSSADLTASLFQWGKSTHILQPRVMSGSFAWFQQLSNLSFGSQWSNMNIFCKYLSGRGSFICHCTKMFEDKSSSIVSYTVINVLLVDLPKFSTKSMITSCLPADPLTFGSCFHMSARIMYGKWWFVPKNNKKQSAA